MGDLLLGLDVGSSSVKLQLLMHYGKTIATAQSPEEEMPITALKPDGQNSTRISGGSTPANVLKPVFKRN